MYHTCILGTEKLLWLRRTGRQGNKRIDLGTSTYFCIAAFSAGTHENRTKSSHPKARKSQPFLFPFKAVGIMIRITEPSYQQCVAASYSRPLKGIWWSVSFVLNVHSPRILGRTTSSQKEPQWMRAITNEGEAVPWSGCNHPMWTGLFPQARNFLELPCRTQIETIIKETLLITRTASLCIPSASHPDSPFI